MVTYGFYNSLEHDRVYNAEQFTSLFDGIIRDGVLSSIGNKFMVTPVSGMTVNVGTGRAWFNHTWTVNDAAIPFTLDASHAFLNRIDAIVLEVNASTRINSIKLLKGEEESSPSAPALTNDNTNGIHQYYLAQISVKGGVSDISASMITNKVGTSGTPLATGILQQLTINELIAQWQAGYEELMADNNAAFTSWFNSLEVVLEGDVAANLAGEIVIDPTTIILYENMGWEDPEAGE